MKKPAKAGFFVCGCYC